MSAYIGVIAVLASSRPRWFLPLPAALDPLADVGNLLLGVRDDLRRVGLDGHRDVLVVEVVHGEPDRVLGGQPDAERPRDPTEVAHAGHGVHDLVPTAVADCEHALGLRVFELAEEPFDDERHAVEPGEVAREDDVDGVGACAERLVDDVRDGDGRAAEPFGYLPSDPAAVAGAGEVVEGEALQSLVRCRRHRLSM
ncbi:hypothetical protein EG835_04355 [bacterium]|nr:hypothetical protein [bacterium]